MIQTVAPILIMGSTTTYLGWEAYKQFFILMLHVVVVLLILKAIMKTNFFYLSSFKWSVFLVATIFTTNCYVFGQRTSLDQFYYSEAKPYEVNRDPIKHIDSLLKETRELQGNGFDQENFVYRHNYYLNRLNRSGSVFFQDSISAYMNELKRQIIPDDTLIKVYFTDFPSMNAFTNDFGSIYVHVGALVKLDSEEELMFMLAHEISHVLLSHSYNTELKQNEWGVNNQSTLYERHRFSRFNEFEADSMALTLLSNKVSARYSKSLFERLRNSEDPIQGQTNFGDYRTLFPIGNDSIAGFIENYWPAYVRPEVISEEDDTLSTHPSISKRISRTEEYIFENGTTESFTRDNRTFLHWRETASYLYLNSLISNEQYIEALDLVLKMRAAKQTVFLDESLAAILTSITEFKYRNNPFDQISINGAASISDSSYLGLESGVLGTSNFDFNILTLHILDTLSTQNAENPRIENAQLKATQMLYANKKDWFEKKGADYVLIKKEDLEFEKVVNLEDLLFEVEDLNTIAKNDSSSLLYSIAPEILPSNFPNIVDTYTAQVSSQNSSEIETVSFLDIPPHVAFKKFKRGKYIKSDEYDPAAKKLYLQSVILYVNSQNKRDYEINFAESYKLEALTDSLIYQDNFDVDLSISSKEENSVSDLHMRRLILDQLFSALQPDEVDYYANELEVQEYMKKNDLKYVSMYVAIVNPNKGRGKRQYINFYDITFDPLQGEVAYLAFNASKIKSTRMILENFFYQNSIEKGRK